MSCRQFKAVFKASDEFGVFQTADADQRRVWQPAEHGLMAADPARRIELLKIIRERDIEQPSQSRHGAIKAAEEALGMDF